MTAGELIKELKRYPKDTPLVTEQYSDFVDLPDVEVAVVIVHDDGRYERFHPEQWWERKPDVTKVLYLGR